MNEDVSYMCGAKCVQESYQRNDCKDYESKRDEMTKYLETKTNSIEEAISS